MYIKAYVDYLSSGVQIICKDDKYGVVSIYGDEIVAPKYEDIRPFDYNDRAVVVLNGKCGLIDTEGNEVVEPKYDDIRHFQRALAVVVLGSKYGFIDLDGNEIVAPQYEGASSFCGSVAAVRQNGKWGFIYHNGEMLLPAIYDHFIRFDPMCNARVVLNGKEILITDFGKLGENSYTPYPNKHYIE